MQICRRCNVALPYTAEFFQTAYNKIIGKICRACNRLKSKECHSNKRANDPTWRKIRDLKNSANNKARYAADPAFRLSENSRGLRRAKLLPATYAAQTAKRRGLKLQATPKWLTPRDIADISAVYSLAVKLTRETGTPHHVDHIIPLQGRLVNGLHVPWNLQVISASANISKGNHYADI